MKSVLLPLPDRDFDTTEVAVPWRLLTEAGHRVVFATEHGARGPVPECDRLLISGVIFGQLGADPEPVSFYERMAASAEFHKPIAWSEIEPSAFHGLLLPGGHAPGMRQYLASRELQSKIAAFWKLGRPVGAICHGVIPLARAGVLGDKKTTCLPKYMEALAYGLTFWKLGRYYRTYPAYVEDEVRAALRDPETQFLRGPITLGTRGTASSDRSTFTVVDGNYVSARWPGDSYAFARKFIELLSATRD